MTNVNTPTQPLLDCMIQNILSEHSRLRTNQLFEGLTSSEQELLIGSGVTHLYKKGEIIFREGGIPTGIYYLDSGRAKKFRTMSKGTEQIFYLCTKGELLGYHALLGEELYPDSAATIEDSFITFIPKESFLTVLRQSSALSNNLLKALGQEFTHFINSISNLGTKSVRERLAINLLILDEKFKSLDEPGRPGEIHLSRGDLANMVGTATETLVRLLQEFKSAGLIDKSDRSIIIVNRAGVIKEANLGGLRNKK